MEIYRNLGGYSGVSAYEIGSESINIWFKDGSKHLFTYANAGESNVEEMKILAKSGSGLNSFINDHVRKSASRV